MTVRLPDLGEGMTEAEVVSVFVKVGQKVTVNEPLIEVQTDKMVTELSAPIAGEIKEIYCEEGDEIQVGQLLIQFEGDTELEETVTQPQSIEQPEQLKEQKKNSPQRTLASPYTRKLAFDHGIRLEEITPTQANGIITEQDVREWIEKQQAPAKTEVEKKEMISSNSSTFIPYKGVRKKIGENMVRSLYTIPHVTHFEELIMDEIIAFRTACLQQGKNIRLAAMLYKAVAIALKKYPIFNAVLHEEEEQIECFSAIHLGLATNTEQGLFVPVMKDVQNLSIEEMNQQIGELTAATIQGTISPQLLKGSTFTISNVGPLGSTGGTPIINYPETGLLALHQMKKKPIVNHQDEIVVGHVMNVSLSYDHRVIDGATGIAFTNELKRLIEQPAQLILEMR